MLKLELAPQHLDSGPIEERATFGTLQVFADGRCFTEGVAPDTKELLPGPRVSGYHLAKWLAWNWWRLRWESRPNETVGREWAFSHRLSSIGEGYVWPNVEISSDGVKAIVTSAPTIDPAAGLYRYVGASAFAVIAATDLGAAIDGFVRAMLDLLGGAKADTNLHHIWRDLEREQQDADTTRLRRLEARLGKDPDEIAPERLRSAIEAVRDLGPDVVDELAAHAGARGDTTVISTKALSDTAEEVGSDANPQDAVELHANHDSLPVFGEVRAWRLGISAARALRRQQALDGQPIDNKRLSSLAGTRAAFLSERHAQASHLSFMLTAGGRSRVALRSNWETGRRFDLARLLGDRLLGQDEPLLPATSAYTYRQKAQRAFAAELLCPYEALCEFLGQDRSEERCEDAATHFNVSPWAINSLLLNNEGHRGALTF